MKNAAIIEENEDVKWETEDGHELAAPNPAFELAVIRLRMKQAQARVNNFRIAFASEVEYMSTSRIDNIIDPFVDPNALLDELAEIADDLRKVIALSRGCERIFKAYLAVSSLQIPEEQREELEFALLDIAMIKHDAIRLIANLT